MNLQEAYKTLELPETATQDEVNKACRKLMAKWHPDKNPGNAEAEAKFKLIGQAKETIANPPQQIPNINGNPFSGFVSGLDGFNIQDIFNSEFFGGQQGVQRQVANIHINETLTFKESIFGCSKSVKYKRDGKCTACNGQHNKKIKNNCTDCDGFGKIIKQYGQMIQHMSCNKCRGKCDVEVCKACKDGTIKEDKTITVKIPGGVVQGNILRSDGAGHFVGTSHFGDEHTSVDLHINVEKSNIFKVEGKDLISHLDISLIDALKGSLINIETLDGNKSINIPKLSRNKDEIIIKNLGINRKGNQRVILNVYYPEKEDINKIINILNNEQVSD